MLLHASRRSLYGRADANLPSRFLDELPDEGVERERLAARVVVGLRRLLGAGARASSRRGPTCPSSRRATRSGTARSGPGSSRGSKPGGVVTVRFEDGVGAPPHARVRTARAARVEPSLVAVEIRPCTSHEELAGALNAISHYFGHVNTVEDAERFANWIEVERMHAAWDDGRVVGGAGAFTYDLSVPGGATVPSAGVTVVGVLPTHRRRGILSAMMRAQLDDVRARGESVAWLWASEAPIYTRYGYGLASLIGDIDLPRERTAFARPVERRGTFRFVDLDEALEAFPEVHEAALAQRPGMFRRTRAWWETRRLVESPFRRARDRAAQPRCCSKSTAGRRLMRCTASPRRSSTARRAARST